MSQELRVVPASLLDLAVKTLHGLAPGRFSVEADLRAIVDAPVPPAGGDVEVLSMREVMIAYENANAIHLSGTSNFCAVMAKHLNKSVGAKVTRLQAENAQLVADCWTACGGNGPATRDDLLAALRIMNEAEDELTAERDALKDEVDRMLRMAPMYKEEYENSQSELTKLKEDLRLEKLTCRAMSTQANDWAKLAAERKSELTKARDLLARLSPWMERANEKSEDADIPECLELRDFLAHQSAPVAKLSLVECDACPTSSGCVEKCMKAPVAKDVE